VTTEESAPEVSGTPQVPVVFFGDLWKRRQLAYVLGAIILLALIAVPCPHRKMKEFATDCGE
jgi:hypothetical protein